MAMSYSAYRFLESASWLAFLLTYVMSYGQHTSSYVFTRWEADLLPFVAVGAGVLYRALRPRLNAPTRTRWGFVLLAAIGLMLISDPPSAFALAAAASIPYASSDVRAAFDGRLSDVVVLIAVIYGIALVAVPFSMFGDPWTFARMLGVIWFFSLVYGYIELETNEAARPKGAILSLSLLLPQMVVFVFATWWVWTGFAAAFQDCLAEPCHGWFLDFTRCKAKCVLTRYLQTLWDALALVIFVAYVTRTAVRLRARATQGTTQHP